MKALGWVAVLMVLCGVLTTAFWMRSGKATLKVATPATSPTTALSVTPSPQPSPASVASTPKSLPETALLKVPFVVQAPLANWDVATEETCEEASLYMVVLAQKNQEAGTPTEQEAWLRDMVAYQTNQGLGPSITLAQLAAVADDYLGMKAGRIITNPSADDLRRELAEGRPVIIPAAGQLLGNPYFKDPGPVYHMLVLVGYEGDVFIANDPGTKRGASYRYTEKVIMSALHDYNAQDILQGEPRALVFN